MKKTVSVASAAPVAAEVTPKQHPLTKSHMFVSNRHVDYNNLTTFEAVSMASVFALAVFAGVLQSVVS